RTVTDPQTNTTHDEDAKPVDVTITQSLYRTLLRQEYVDYGLEVPDISEVGVIPDTKDFRGIEFTQNSNYPGFGVNGGMEEIAQSVRTEYGDPILITSAYRNPQRNKDVGGTVTSIHQTGGAVDMRPVVSQVDAA